MVNPVTRLVEDHREHRPASARDWLVYALEVALALGLFWRAAWHTLGWFLVRDWQGHKGVTYPDLEVESGLTTFAVTGDVHGDIGARWRGRIQLATSVATIAFVLFVVHAFFIKNKALWAAVVGPSVAFAVLDPLWPALQLYREQTTTET